MPDENHQGRAVVEGLFRNAWALYVNGKLEAAEDALRKLLGLEPANAAAFQVLGLVMHGQGRSDDAIEVLNRSLALAREAAEGHSNLAHVLVECERLEEAISHARRAIQLKPDYPEAFTNLGAAMSRLGCLDEAESAYRRAIALRWAYPDAHNNLGNVLRRMGRLRDAVRSHEHALNVRPNYPAALESMATTLEELGRVEEALDCRRRLVARPDCSSALHSALLYDMHLGDGHPAEALFAEHLAWAHRYAKPLMRPAAPHDNEPDPDRTIRVGYVSADFRDHAVGRFAAPFLTGHDPRVVMTICYSNGRSEDTVTARIRESVEWRKILAMSDEQAADLIRRDRVDILVDLSGHTAGHRLGVFARRPAPIQVTYLGYPDTTGMTAMDYRITDETADPPGLTERYHTEELIRLGRCAWCYPRPETAGAPKDLCPRAQSAPITFGTPSRLCRLSACTIERWADLLRKVPFSRLLVMGPANAVEELRGKMAAFGVERHRINAASRGTESHYWQTLRRIDIALDPFPYNGTGTTCDLLWAGVPVVTLVGVTHASRVGASLLTAIGLLELIAQSPEEYVGIAADLAEDAGRLERLRTQIVPRACVSPLADTADMVRHLERAYRNMWQRWCAKS